MWTYALIFEGPGHTSLGCLRLEDLDGLASTEEGPDEVDVDDALEGLQRYFLYGHLRRVDARVLREMEVNRRQGADRGARTLKSISKRPIADGLRRHT